MRQKFYPALAALLLPFFGISQNLLNPKSQDQFENPLPIPSVVDVRSGGTYNFIISQFNQNLGLKNPVTKQPLLTTVWGYNGAYPGPTIVAQKDMPVNIFWHNRLVNQSSQPLPHLLPVDVSLHWALMEYQNPQNIGVPVVTHLHGGHTESASDGLPDAWYTPGFALRGHGFIKGDVLPYHYNNDQEAATLWYHDHTLGITRLNVYAGLAGFYILTDNTEITLQAENKLPGAPYDIGLVIQDRMFTEDGQLFFPSAAEMPGQPLISALPEFFGDFILVNGAAWPFLEVEPRPYRFRVLNGSDSRFYNLWLSNGTSFTQIGTDNGLLPVPVTMTQMLIGTGERRDVIIDFSNMEGQTIIMRNNAKTPYPKGSAPDPETAGKIMAFKVTKPFNTSIAKSNLPATLRTPIVPLHTSLPSRKLILFEAEDEYGRLKPMLGTFEEGVIGWNEPITENPALNSTEIWEIYNETMDAHTIHLHLVKMQLISRQKFKAHVDEEDGKPEEVRLIGQPKYPGPDEMGWKDTYIMMPGEVTRVIAHFDLPGLYVWHCHILSHEDHEMMRPYFVGVMGNDMVYHKVATKEAEKLLQLAVFPNPFNAILRVDFTLQHADHVVMNVYDVKGSLVKQVYNGQRESGKHHVVINGDNFSNGVYFLELVVNGKSVIRKLVLSK